MFYANEADALNGLWELLEARGILPHCNDQPEAEIPSSEDSSSEPHQQPEQSNEHSEETNDSPSSATEASSSSTVEVSSTVQKPKLQDLTAPEIQTALLTALNKCPNRSCTLKAIPKNTLKELGIITRGNPLAKFTTRLHSNIRAMEAAGKVELYKATNERIRISRDYLL